MRKIFYSSIIISLISLTSQAAYVGAQTAVEEIVAEPEIVEIIDAAQPSEPIIEETINSEVPDGLTASSTDNTTTEEIINNETLNNPTEESASAISAGDSASIQDENISTTSEEIILENANLNALNNLSSSAPATYCGDGIIQPNPESDLENDDFVSEQCDDGNTENGDGCSENCQIEICIDNDEDSYGQFCELGLDCDDENNLINPSGTEICGNGIDEDCSGSDLACPLPPAPPAPQPPASPGGSSPSWSPASQPEIVLAEGNNPNNPTNFKAAGLANGISLTWKNPTGSFNEVIVMRSINVLGSYLTTEQVKQSAQEIYRGKGESFIDNKIIFDTKYYYALISYNSNSKTYSDPLFVSATVNYARDVDKLATEDNPKVLGDELEDYLNIDSLFGVSGDIADIVSYNEANTIYAQNYFVSMDEASVNVYKKINYANFAYAKDIDSYRKAHFIFYGTPTTKSLGAGERGGALVSYISAFRKIPTTVEEWQDVIKIANGRWSAEKNEDAEKAAKEKFKKIYLRDPLMSNPTDNAAVTVIAYGLRPANRNFVSEKAAINSYKYIFKKGPENASDWDIVRAIAYSGAKR